MRKKTKKQLKVIIAMSGGIDSSVAAALLKKGLAPHQSKARYGVNFDVVGIFMKFWAPQGGATQINTDKNADLHGYENRCCTPESEKRARLVAEKLNIPFYVLNFEKEFKKKVVDYFLKEYRAGRTPNPCVVCNKEIKFGLLLEKVLKLGADFVATGHYARLRRVGAGYKLLKARDKNKDQSYFLWRLNQKILKKTLFPVGGYTKTEVRRLAKEFKLPVLNIPESQEVCFIPTTISDFLRERLKSKPGKIINVKGSVIGEHQGLWFYTIGQRKGIKVASGKPYYVLSKDVKKNLLIVSQNKKDLYKKELIAKNVNWVSNEKPKFPLKVMAKIRYRHNLASAILLRTKDGRIKVVFPKPQKAITPGQSVVFYKGEELLGGGTIDKVIGFG